MLNSRILNRPSKHSTTVKNTHQIITFLPKLLHNTNKSRTFVLSVLAKRLNNAQIVRGVFCLWHMLYRFDKKLRLLMFNEIEKIEIAVRRAVMQIPAEMTNDPFWLTTSAHFLNIISPGNDMLDKMQALFVEYPEVDLSTLGFPSGNWQDEPLWSTR